jgi:hypothetical protein
MSETQALSDTLKLLKTLVEPCSGGASDHSWRKCKRCIAVHLVDSRDPVAMRLLATAIRAVEPPPENSLDKERRERLEREAMEDWGPGR